MLEPRNIRIIAAAIVEVGSGVLRIGLMIASANETEATDGDVEDK